MVVRHAGETVLFISIASLRRQQHALHTSSYGNNGSLVIHPPKLGGMMIVSAPRWHISSANNYGCPLGQVFARGAVWNYTVRRRSAHLDPDCTRGAE